MTAGEYEGYLMAGLKPEEAIKQHSRYRELERKRVEDKLSRGEKKEFESSELMDQILKIYIDGDDRADDVIAREYIMKMAYSIFDPVFKNKLLVGESENLAFNLAEMGEDSAKAWITARIFGLKER